MAQCVSCGQFSSGSDSGCRYCGAPLDASEESGGGGYGFLVGLVFLALLIVAVWAT